MPEPVGEGMAEDEDTMRRKGTRKARIVVVFSRDTLDVFLDGAPVNEALGVLARPQTQPGGEAMSHA